MQRADTKNMQDEIDFEMMNINLQQSRVASCTNVMLAIFVALSFYNSVATKNIVIWLSIIFAINAYGYYTSLHFTPNLPMYQVGFFRDRRYLLYVLSGLSWGSVFYFLLDKGHTEALDFRLIAVVGCVIAFAASAISASYRGLVYFVGAASLMSTWHFLQHIDFILWWFFALLGIVSASLFYGKKDYDFVLSLVENRLLNASYIDELHLLNDKIETNNQDFVKRNVELQHMQKRLQLLASHDELTGLHNRRYVLERIEEKLPEIRRHQLNFCLTMMDVDHFKSVNDEFGHAAGDDVLRETSQILTRELRQGDIVARYGGEEFLMLLPMTELSSAEMLVERLRGAIEKKTYTFEGTKISVTASFGLTQYAQDDTADKMIDRADKALYQAKLAGRNCVKVVVKPE